MHGNYGRRQAYYPMTTSYSGFGGGSGTYQSGSGGDAKAPDTSSGGGGGGGQILGWLLGAGQTALTTWSQNQGGSGSGFALAPAPQAQVPGAAGTQAGAQVPVRRMPTWGWGLILGGVVLGGGLLIYGATK